MRLSIRYQLLLPLLMLILGVVGISGWTAWSAAARTREEIEAHMDAVAKTAQSVTFPRTVSMLQLMKSLSSTDLLLCDQWLRPLRDPEGKPVTTLPDLPDTLPKPDGEVVAELGVPVEVAGQTFFCRAVPLGRDAAPGLVLFQFYPEALYRAAVWQAIRPALILGLVGGVVSVLLTVVITQRLTRRIQELERRTALIAQGDFSPMAVPRRNDELRDLARSVNDMAQQLARYQETMRTTERLRLLGQVSGGLAHQLRNGVAGARLAVQLHARECADARDAETLQVALRQLALVELHLKRFLDLGRAGDMRHEACDVVGLLKETMALVGPQCQHAHIDLRWREGEPGQTEAGTPGDPEHLRHLFLNLLTNAVEAATPGGWVEVHAAPRNGKLEVEIADSGPGPEPRLAAKLFEPFVTGKPEGVGLGLSVARQVAQAHGGTISWQRGADRTTFRVELPVAGALATAGSGT